MLFGKDRGPIYSRRDIDKPGSINPVVDYAAPARSREDIEFIIAHKITPMLAEPGDMQHGAAYTSGENVTSLRTLMRPPSTSQFNRRPVSPGATANARRQSRAILFAVFLWILFILLSMLLSVFR